MEADEGFPRDNFLARHPIFSLAGRTDSVTVKSRLSYGADFDPYPPSLPLSSVHSPDLSNK